MLYKAPVVNICPCQPVQMRGPPNEHIKDKVHGLCPGEDQDLAIEQDLQATPVGRNG